MTSKINYDRKAAQAIADKLSRFEEDFAEGDPLWDHIRFTLAAICLACVAVALAWEFWPL